MIKMAALVIGGIILYVIAVLWVLNRHDPPVKLDCEHQYIHITFADGTALFCSPQQENLDAKIKGKKESPVAEPARR